MKIGILGGGQLGRMLIQEALKYDDEFYTLDPAPDAPCHNISYFTQGNFNDYETVLNFGKDKDVVTIEIEHVNIEALEQLEKEGKQVFPQPHILRMIQDKRLQKQFFQDHFTIAIRQFIIQGKGPSKFNYTVVEEGHPRL